MLRFFFLRGRNKVPTKLKRGKKHVVKVGNSAATKRTTLKFHYVCLMTIRSSILNLESSQVTVAQRRTDEQTSFPSSLPPSVKWVVFRWLGFIFGRGDAGETQSAEPLQRTRSERWAPLQTRQRAP